MVVSIQDRVFTLLAEIDAVAAEEEHRTTILSSGEPSLGLGLVALALSEQWRPKRTERLRLHRDDAIETEFLCELDLDAATAITRTTCGAHGIWLPLHRLRQGLMPPASATDDTGAQLPVMSRGEAAAHVGAGVAQILGSGVFREAFGTRSRSVHGTTDPLGHRRRTPASVILREAVTRIVMRSWSDEGQPPPPIDDKHLTGCGSCAAFSDQPPLTLREFGLARYLLHQAAHSWLTQGHARQVSTFRDLRGLEYLSEDADPKHCDPHFVVDAGLNALEVVKRGAIVVAHAHQVTGRTTITTALPPRRREALSDNNADSDDRGPREDAQGVPGNPPRKLALSLDPLVVSYQVELSGLRLNQALGLEARVESGVELASVPSGGPVAGGEGSHVSVLLKESTPLTSPPMLTSGGTLPALGDASSPRKAHLPPHPVPELTMAVDNLLRAQCAYPAEAGSTPLPLGTFAALNRCGAHASQVARLLDITEQPTQASDEEELISDLRSFAQTCQDMIEDPNTADESDLNKVCIEGRRLAERCQEIRSREQRFVDADYQPGVFRCQIGRKDIPDRFIRPLRATATLRAQLEPGLAATLRQRVLTLFARNSVLLIAMMFVVWLVRPSSEPVITILLAVPAVSVFLQRIPNVATLRSQLETPYRRWQYLSLAAPVVAALAALSLRECDRQPAWNTLVTTCDGEASLWWQLLAPVLSLVLMGLAWWRLTRKQHVDPVFAVSAFEPRNPSYDELRQIGQTAADSASRATQGGPWYVVARSADPAFGPTGPVPRTAPPGPNCMGLPEVAPTSEFWVRLGRRNYEFTSVRAKAGTATTELLRPVFIDAWPTAEAPIVRSFSSVADAPVFGAGQLSEAWLAWDEPDRSDPGPFIRDVALLGAAYDGPLSYFHLRSWENGHLFSRVGTLLSQRGHRDEVAFEGAVSAIARQHHPGPTAHLGHDYLSFLPPTFLQSDAASGPPPGPPADTDGISYWDVILLATAHTDTAHEVLDLFGAHPNVRVVDGSMTIVRGIEAIVLALRLDSSDGGCSGECERRCDCLKRSVDIDLRNTLQLESDRLAPRLLWRNVDEDYLGSDQFGLDQTRQTLWIGWSGTADHADCNWVLDQVHSWFSTMRLHDREELRIEDLELDYLVCRQRRGTSQVGRARISFRARADVGADSFGVWEATLTKSLQYPPERPPEDCRRAIPTGLVVDVQRFEPRSQRYSGSKLGGQAP